MSSKTSLVATQVHLQSWVEQIREYQSRPSEAVTFGKDELLHLLVQGLHLFCDCRKPLLLLKKHLDQERLIQRIQLLFRVPN